MVEGWRTGTHSYALVNQAQLREMGGRSDIRVTHRDLAPPGEPDGTPTARPDDRAVSTPAHVAGDIADVAYRIAAPFDLTASEHARRTVVFLTTEHHYMPDVLMAGGKPFAEAYRSSDAHLVTPSDWSRDGLIASGADPTRVTVVPLG
ncbi:MAG: glycosyl transferase family 1, partial [Chloroflexi bacterium]